MKLIIILGPQAVGKMSVGQELEKLTELKLFHNHMTIDLVSNFFSYGTKEGQRLVQLFRQEIFEEVSKSSLYGLIFTYVWAFEEQSDWDYIQALETLFESRGGEVYFVELESSLEERMVRNVSEHRLACKPTKRDVVWSQQDLIQTAKKYRLNSLEGEIKSERYLRMDTTNCSAVDVAKLVKEKWSL